MKPQFDQNLISSFYLWADNKLCSENEAFLTGQVQDFFYLPSRDLDNNFVAFYSSNKQFAVESDSYDPSVYIEGVKLNQNLDPSGFSISYTGSESYAFLGQYSKTGEFDGKDIYNYDGFDIKWNDAENRWELRDLIVNFLQAYSESGSYDNPWDFEWPINGGFLTVNRDVFLAIDNNLGRIILKSGEFQNNISVSGNFPQKEINLYISNDTDEEILMGADFLLNETETFYQKNEKLNSIKYLFPCIFISYDSSMNIPFAMGGTRDTKNYIKMIIFASSNYQLESIMSIFRDSSERVLPIINFEDFPYGYFWQLKESPYSYSSLIQSQNCKCAFIEKANCFKLKDSAQGSISKIRKDLFIGYVDFQISTIRSIN